PEADPLRWPAGECQHRDRQREGPPAGAGGNRGGRTIVVSIKKGNVQPDVASAPTCSRYRAPCSAAGGALTAKPRAGKGSVIPRMPAGHSVGLLPGNTSLLGWLRVRHVRTVNAEHPAAVYSALEAAQRAIDGFVISNLNTYGQKRSLLVRSG